MFRCAKRCCVRCFSGKGDYEEVKRNDLVGHERKPGETHLEAKQRIYADLEEHDRLNQEYMSAYSAFANGGWLDIPQMDAGATGRIVFMFMVVGRLKNEDWWEEWFSSADRRGYQKNYSIVYHRGMAYGKDCDPIADDLLARRGVSVLPATKTGWARSGLIRANLLMLRFGLEVPENRWFILLSDSCMPLYSFPYLYDLVSRQNQSRFHDFGDITLDAAMNRNIWKEGMCDAKNHSHKADQWAMWIRADAEWFVREDHLAKLKPLAVFCDEPFFINMMDHDHRPYENIMVSYNSWYHLRDIPCPCYRLSKWKRCLSSPHTFHKVTMRHIRRARREGCWFIRKVASKYPSCAELELHTQLEKGSNEMELTQSLVRIPLTE